MTGRSFPVRVALLVLATLAAAMVVPATASAEVPPELIAPADEEVVPAEEVDDLQFEFEAESDGYVRVQFASDDEFVGGSIECDTGWFFSGFSGVMSWEHGDEIGDSMVACPLDPGTHYWRVQWDGAEEDPWSDVSSFTLLGACNTDDTSGCVPGSVLEVHEQKFDCTEPLEDIAEENGLGSEPGTLPLLVQITFDEPVNLDPAVVDLRTGCSGLDGNAPVVLSDDCEEEPETCYSGAGYEPGDVDLILDIQGDGETLGGRNDLIKVRTTAADIVVTGQGNCGPRHPGLDGRYRRSPSDPFENDDGHQDGVQVQGGTMITFVDFEWGDWETETSTCGGACGAFCVGVTNSLFPTEDVVCIGCKAVTCNHGLFIGGDETPTIRSGAISSFFRTGDDQWKTTDAPEGIDMRPIVNGSANPDYLQVVDNGEEAGQCHSDSNACIRDDDEIDAIAVDLFCDRWDDGYHTTTQAIQVNG